MITLHSFRRPEFRERVTEAILEMLTRLPETQRNIFVWNRYRGYAPKQISEILRSSPSEVEATLDAINSILYQRTRSLLEEDLQLEAEVDLPPASSRTAERTLQPSILGSVVDPEGTQPSWPETLNTLILSEEGGKTTITLRVLYPSKEARDAALETGMKEGVSQSFDRLAEYLRTRA